jgi:hypothetical protein
VQVNIFKDYSLYGCKIGRIFLCYRLNVAPGVLVLTGHLIPSITSPTRIADFPHITLTKKDIVMLNKQLQ